MLEICKGAIDTSAFFDKWEQYAKANNCGAYIVFDGIVRSENDISALSFDIYEPLLQKWFKQWQEKAKKSSVIIFMTHSIGEVKVGESSFLCAILSSHRKSALKLYEIFIEDFKANAPIWKYDIKNGKRFYAKQRSFLLKGAGILNDKNHKL